MTASNTLTQVAVASGNTHPRSARWLALGAVAGPVLFTLAWLILGAISPGYTVARTWISPYSPITQPISGLGLGQTARYMNTTLVMTGSLLLVGVIGIARTMLPGGRRVIVIGFFTLDQPGMHFLGALLILASPVVSFLITGLHLRRLPGWHRFGNKLLVASPLTLVLFVVYSLSFSQSAVAAGHGYAGLTQRVLFLELLAWFVAMGWLAYRRTTSTTDEAHQH
jgi:hypothetical protein